MSKVELLSITVRLREGFLCQAASVLIADANGGHHDLIANTRSGQIYAAEMFGIMPGMKALISAVIAVILAIPVEWRGRYGVPAQPEAETDLIEVSGGSVATEKKGESG